MNKEMRKILRRKIGFFVLVFFTRLGARMPLSWSYRIGSVTGQLAFRLLKRHRRTAISGLTTAFPEWDEARIRRTAKASFVHMAQSSWEMLYYLDDQQALDRIHVEGLEHLDAAQARGRGVIIVSAHLGNFPLMSLRLSRLGYPIYVVARPMRDEQTGVYMQKLRDASGVRTILSYPRRACVTGILQALRNQSVVWMQMDQNFGTGGVWVRFFGKLAATPAGPVTMALRTKAAVVPGYLFRDPVRNTHTLRLLPAEELQETEDRDKTVLVNVMRFTSMIESWIRLFPEQWGWVHRRWKARPNEKVRKEKYRVEDQLEEKSIVNAE
ncbi:MAG: hypothetical protein GF333_00010 [Candidatus Omnitrophica bacterium]|nr:hypothetical protein [Candidatus Omnitrophota bacterium]